MKSKRFRGVLAAALAICMVAVLAWPAAMMAQGVKVGGAYYYFFQVQNEYGEPFTTDGYVACSVYTYGANGSGPSTVVHSAASLAQGTGLAGPLYSSTNGIIHWYSSTNGPVNAVCYTKGGDSGRVAGMTIQNHRMRIATDAVDKTVRFPFSGGASAKYMTTTGITIPEGAVVTGVAVQLATSPAQFGHIDVGFDGNHTVATGNALATRMDLQRSQGMLLVHQGGAFGTAASLGAHLGLALRHSITQGSGTPTTTQQFNGGYLVHVTGGLTLNYSTPAGSQGGHVYVFYKLLHAAATPGY